jgi:hypothetical protein
LLGLIVDAYKFYEVNKSDAETDHGTDRAGVGDVCGPQGAPCD